MKDQDQDRRRVTDDQERGICQQQTQTGGETHHERRPGQGLSSPTEPALFGFGDDVLRARQVGLRYRLRLRDSGRFLRHRRRLIRHLKPSCSSASRVVALPHDLVRRVAAPAWPHLRSGDGPVRSPRPRGRGLARQSRCSGWGTSSFPSLVRPGKAAGAGRT